MKNNQVRGIKKYAINFSKYFSVGLFVTLLNIFFSWLFIDIFGIRALISTIIIGICILFIKYFGYVQVKLIKKKFIIFMIINISSVISYIILATLLVDILSVPTLIAIPSIVLLLFLLRFFVFYWTKIIQE